MRNDGDEEIDVAEKSLGERVLVVEDEPKISAAVTTALRSAGYEVITSASAEDAFFVLHAQHPHLLVLDLGLPHRSGMDVLVQIRAMSIQIPILILTSNASLDDRVAALDAGADDFLLKPFNAAELCARVRAISRRGLKQPSQDTVLHLADLEISVETRAAWRGGTKLELTVREFDLLVFLIKHRGRPCSRDMLAREVWHETSRFTPIDNVISVQMTRLRRKVDDPFPRKLLRTIRGVGFLIDEDEEDTER